MLQYQIDRIEHQVEEDRSQSGVFLIGPLERGQATTLGNALRPVSYTHLTLPTKRIV